MIPEAWTPSPEPQLVTLLGRLPTLLVLHQIDGVPTLGLWTPSSSMRLLLENDKPGGRYERPLGPWDTSIDLGGILGHVSASTVAMDRERRGYPGYVPERDAVRFGPPAWATVWADARAALAALEVQP